MGKLIRGYDWGKTDLGIPGNWPQSLQTMVAMMLDNPFGMYIAWGTEHIQLYNDAYRPILGMTKHPKALGSSSKETFSEIWDTIGPMMDGVMNGIPVRFTDLQLNLNRNGYDEECYFDFSYSPIRKDNGEVGGVLVTVVETTDKKKAEEGLKESEARFRAIADDAPVFIFLAGENAEVEYLNKTWRDYTGIAINDSKGRAWAEITHPDDVDPATKIYMDGFTKRESCSFENRQKGADGIYRTILWKATPRFAPNGQFIGMMGVGLDIDDRKKAEEQFRVLADQAPMWVWLTDKEVNVIYTNPEVLRFLGIAHYTAFTGKLWERKVHPDDIEMVYRSFAGAVALQQSFAFEFRVRNAATQQYEWFYLKAVPRIESGECTGFIGTGININEQRLILSQLEYRKALLEAHNESSLDGILLVDAKGRILSHNSRFAEIWNMPKQIINDKDDDAALAFALTQLVDPEQFMQRVRWMYDNPKAISVDELEFTDGKIIERYGYHVSGADGSYYGCSWTFRDITEQRKYERAVKESEEKFRLLANSMPQHVWTSDPEGHVNYYNQSVFDYSGLTLEQLAKDGWIQIVHPDDREENISQWMNAITTGTDFVFEHRFRRHDGEYRWQLSRAIPQRDEKGTIQMWVGTSNDIQEQKSFAMALEEQVAARTAELKASEEKFYNLFNLSPVSKTLSDRNTGKIVMVNDAFTKLFGYGSEEAVGKSSAELGLLDLEQREILIKELETNKKIENREIRFIKKSGEKFIALTAAELISIGGKQFFLSAFNDISEIRNAERHVRQKNTELEKMNKELQSFAYISSHDLQEPLRKIQTFASRINQMEENNLSEPGKNMFIRMQVAANRMQTLIQDLLAYSRTNVTEYRFELTDLNQIIAEVKEDLEEELLEKQAIIKTGVLFHVAVIPFQFRQLLVNLISNSLKFIKPETLPIVEISSAIGFGKEFPNPKLSPEILYCHIRVSDNGIGFEQQYNEKIFEVFQRLHGKHEYIGTGIGLSIVKKIVDNHHGYIDANGEPRKGATFNIYLPAPEGM